MANILKLQDQLKGLPDNALFKYAQNPTGTVPQYLVLAELQRRKTMREEFQQGQTQAPEQTVAEELVTQQLMEQGIAALPSPEAMFGPTSMAGGGIVAFENGGEVPSYQDGGRIAAARTLLAQTTDPQTRAELLAEIAAMEAEQNSMVAPAVDVPSPKLKNPFEIERREVGDYLGDIREAYKTYGVSEAPFEEQKKSLKEMEEEDVKMRAQAPWMSLLQAGLGMAAGQSPFALTNIATGGISGLKNYADTLGELRKSKKEIQRSAFDLARAEDALKRGDIKTAVDLARENMRDIQAAGMEEAKMLSREEQAALDRASAETRERMQQEGAMERTKLQERGAAARAAMPGTEERVVGKILADMQKDNPKATFSDAIERYKRIGKDVSLELFEIWSKMDYAGKKVYNNSFTDFADAYRRETTTGKTPSAGPAFRMDASGKITPSVSSTR